MIILDDLWNVRRELAFLVIVVVGTLVVILPTPEWVIDLLFGPRRDDH